MQIRQTILPSNFKSFLTNLFKSKPNELNIKINSLGQDLLYVINNGQLLTPKHILLPFTVKSLTGNVELVKILNRLGHGVSYSKICEIEAFLASQKISKSNVIIPESIQIFIPTTLVFDNIDRLEETLSGSDTTHRVNSIAVQSSFIGPFLPKSKEIIPKTKQRSIDVPIIEIPIYIVRKKTDARVRFSRKRY